MMTVLIIVVDKVQELSTRLHHSRQQPTIRERIQGGMIDGQEAGSEPGTK